MALVEMNFAEGGGTSGGVEVRSGTLPASTTLVLDNLPPNTVCIHVLMENTYNLYGYKDVSAILRVDSGGSSIESRTWVWSDDSVRMNSWWSSQSRPYTAEISYLGE